MMLGVVRVCFWSKCDWSVSSMILGSEVISFVAGLRLVDRLGLFLAFGRRPAAVLRFWNYHLELFF